MKISVLASVEQKRELQSKPTGNSIEFSWVDGIEALENEPGVDVYFDLGFVNERTRINHLKRLLPRPVFINSVTHQLSSTDPGFIRMNGWPTFLQRPIWELAVASEERKAVADEVFNNIAWATCFVPDTKGMISARVIAMIINEAYHALGAGISSKAEIDIAMKLGTNYPYGPFEWSKKIGLKNIYELLFELGKTDQRYEMAEALRNEWVHFS